MSAMDLLMPLEPVSKVAITIFLSLGSSVTFWWLWDETRATRKRNRALRKARKRV